MNEQQNITIQEMLKIANSIINGLEKNDEAIYHKKKVNMHVSRKSCARVNIDENGRRVK